MKNNIKTSRVFMLSTLALFMTACSTIPQKSQSVLAQPKVPVELPYKVLDVNTTISTPEAPSLAGMRWQDFYADPKLKALIEMGLTHNKDLQSAILAVQSARAQYQITNANAYPNIGVSGGAIRGADARDRNPSTNYNVGLALSSYELDLWGRVASAKEAALHDYLAQNSAKDAAQISIISAIAQGYVNLSYAMAQRQLALETLKTREHSLFINNKRFEAGIDAKSTSLQAEASLESAKLAVYQADTNILKTKNALQLLLGTPIPVELLPDLGVNNITTQSLFSAGLPSELLYYRPDIVQAEHRLKAAGANINVARAAYFPSIRLSSNIGYGSTDLGDLFKSGAFSWSVGPSISLPIFDAGYRRANYEVAQIGQKQALVNYEKTIQTAFKEVSDVLATRATMEHQLNSQYRLQKNYQETYNIAHARFRSGLDNYLNVLDAERSLFANQQSILNLELQKILSQIELYQVLGGGATLSAEQITNFNKQREAMQTASLATAEQLANAQIKGANTATSPELVQPEPNNISVVEPSNVGGVATEPTTNDAQATSMPATNPSGSAIIKPADDSEPVQVTP
ncbi:efflux transporter outer membrane subunit [Moraxella bovis]|uniref:Efflux transporter outer membrane subunit n=1 Tax=Moraxella bovis TaxID=476 RepID=A0A378PX18_MORBO|nr:efflux transporter outer membrane subunit [Moraxella bovis]UYZ74971.1 efflux transporter outer membrane subunit [Moraxella bovis]UYZ80315.1 efflux transporter outer membrane subunit [Moraxella bovis]UYZ90317.1 efflux transporter outer membrane subunit [Moraxella bovis]UYZ93007.1 efflux transporter outer membrane subunit [Moraxella bovis]UYZ94514.1 efflux transporter outer membrane subunit [Moraxella bovis]